MDTESRLGVFSFLAQIGIFFFLAHSSSSGFIIASFIIIQYVMTFIEGKLHFIIILVLFLLLGASVLLVGFFVLTKVVADIWNVGRNIIIGIWKIKIKLKSKIINLIAHRKRPSQ